MPTRHSPLPSGEVRYQETPIYPLFILYYHHTTPLHHHYTRVLFIPRRRIHLHSRGGGPVFTVEISIPDEWSSNKVATIQPAGQRQFIASQKAFRAVGLLVYSGRVVLGCKPAESCPP